MKKNKKNQQDKIEVLQNPAQMMSQAGVFPDDPTAYGSALYRGSATDGAQPIAGTTREGLRDWAEEHQL